MTKPVAILGAGGNAGLVADMCRAVGRPVAAQLDLEGEARLEDADFVAKHDFVLGLGDPKIRRRLIEWLDALRCSLASIIHPSAVVSPATDIAAGTVLVAGAIVNVEAKLGRRIAVYTAASVDHDCRLAENTQICPGAHLSGFVTCVDDAFVSTGVSVAPGCHIGAGAIGGAGAAVVADIPDGATAVAVPARVLGE